MKSRYYDSNEILIGDGSTYPDTITAAALAALLDHGTLTGLSDDDHTQYLLIDGTRAMTGNLTMPNAGYVKFGSDFTGWRGSSTSAYVRGYIGVTAKLNLNAASLNPVTNDGLTLGTTSASWADLYLASGGAINWNNGTATITESSGAVAIGSNSATAFNVLNDVGASAYAQIYNAGGTGYWSHIHSSGTLYLGTSGTGGFAFYTDNSGSTVQFAIARTASAVNYMQVTGGPAGGTPTITMQGSDADVGLDLATKGSDPFRFFTNSTVQQFAIAHTASAVNYIQTSGGATGTDPNFFAQGETNVGLQFWSSGTGGFAFRSGGSLYTQFVIANTTSAVNYLQATGGVTGSPGVTYLSAQGTDSNVSMYLQTKGTGALGITSGSSISIAYFYPGATNANYFQFFASAAGSSPTIQFAGTDTNVSGVYRTQAAGGHYFYTNSGAQLQFVIAHTASAVNYWQFAGAATAQGLTCYAAGSDTNIPITFVSKGSGALTLYGNGGSQLVVSPTASAVDYHQFAGAATGANQAILWSAQGSDSTIAIGIKPKGAAGCVQVGPDTGVSSNPTRVLQIRPGGTGRSQLGLQAYDSAGAGQMAIDFIANNGTALGAIGTVSVTGNPIIYTNPTAHSFNTGAGTYGGGNRQFYVAHTASAVNYLTATGGATGSPVTISTDGTDASAGIDLKPKGSAAVSVRSTSDSHLYGGLQFYRSNGSSRGAVVQGGDDNTYLGNQAAGGVHFFSNGSSSFQTNFVISHTASSSRYITVAGSNGGNPTISTSAGALALGNGQLQWPASQAASSDANTLDDYEEGTWTPTVGGTSTYSARTAYYCKIGEQFIMWWDFTISSIGTGSTSIVSGCPFTAFTGKQGTGSGYWAGWSGTYVYTQPVDNGSATMRPYGATAAAGGLSALSPFQNGARWLGQYTQGT